MNVGITVSLRIKKINKKNKSSRRKMYQENVNKYRTTIPYGVPKKEINYKLNLLT